MPSPPPARSRTLRISETPWYILISPVEFDWDEANEEHIARHAVTPEEAEEAFFDASRTRADVYSAQTERRSGLL
jgi:hypothetical protein